MNIPTSLQSKAKPMRCLVIQLARMGDTLQSLMALRAAKQLYPQLEIHFLARENFAIAAKKVPWIQQTITFPTDQLLGPILNGEKSETQSLADLARWIAPLIKDPWDMVVNWTFSDPSSYLTALIPARVKLGYTRRRDSSFSGADGWSHYIQAIVQGRIFQNIHLTDVLTTQLLSALQIHAGEPTGDSNSAVTSKTFFSLTLLESESRFLYQHSGKKCIAIQLGAAQQAKTWNTESWSRFIQLILDKHPDQIIYLLGGKEDKERAQTLIDRLSPTQVSSVMNLAGKTNFDLWATVISRCQWLIAGDTAAIHLASVLGIRVINISVGPVRHFETGPYGNGHYVISSNLPCTSCDSEVPQPLEHSCGQAVSAESAFAVWSYASGEWALRRKITLETHFAQQGWADKLSSIRIFRSKIRNSQDGGGVYYEPILRRPLSLNDWTGMVMGHLARAWYCGWLPPIGQEIQREMIGPELIKKLREMSDSTKVLAKVCQQACKTAESLNSKSSKLKSEKVMGLQDKAELHEIGNTLLELETLLGRVSQVHPALKGFSQMSQVLMHHLQGEQLSELGKEASESYKQLNEGVNIFRQWIHFTLNLARPVVVKIAQLHSVEPILPPHGKEPNP